MNDAFDVESGEGEQLMNRLSDDSLWRIYQEVKRMGMDNGKLTTQTPAVSELGYEKLDDKLAVPNRFVDVREVTNLVRYTAYQVENMRAIITEDIAEGQAAAAMLTHATQGLAAQVAALQKLAGGV